MDLEVDMAVDDGDKDLILRRKQHCIEPARDRLLRRARLCLDISSSGETQLQEENLPLACIMPSEDELMVAIQLQA